MCLFTFVFVSNVFAQWNIQTVDNSGDTGKWSDIAYDSQGYPHIVYYNDTDDYLLYATWTGEGWFIEAIPTSSPNCGQYCSIDIDQFDAIHVSCVRCYSGSNYSFLVYAKKVEQESWSITNIVQSNYSNDFHYTSITTTYDEIWERVVPHVSYHKNNVGDLYYAYLDPETSSWIIMCVDSGGDVGEWTDIAADSDNNIYISYYDNADKDLKIAIYDGNSWGCSIIDGLYTDVGQMTSIVIDDNDIPHVTYYDETSGALKHAELTISK